MVVVVVTVAVVCCCSVVATATAVAAATAAVEVTRGDRIRITLPVATLGVIGLAGFCTACDGTGFCTGLALWTRNGVATAVATAVATDGLAVVAAVATAAATGGVVGGRAATVVTGGDVIGTVAGVAIIAVVTAPGVLTIGVVGVGALTDGKVPVAATGGISYFCI